MGCLDILPHSCQSPSEMPAPFLTVKCPPCSDQKRNTLQPTVHWPCSLARMETKEQTAQTLFLIFWELCTPPNLLDACSTFHFLCEFILRLEATSLSTHQMSSWVMPGFFLLEANHRIFESWCWKISQFKCSRIRCSKKINCDEITSDLLTWLRTPNHTETRNHPSLTEPLSVC